MTAIVHVLPPVHVRETAKSKKRKGGAAKYDAFQMARDRIGGMSWQEIAEKHKVPASGRKSSASCARKVLMISNVWRHLSPTELGRLNWEAVCRLNPRNSAAFER